MNAYIYGELNLLLFLHAIFHLCLFTRSKMLFLKIVYFCALFGLFLFVYWCRSVLLFTRREWNFSNYIFKKC